MAKNVAVKLQSSTAGLVTWLALALVRAAIAVGTACVVLWATGAGGITGTVAVRTVALAVAVLVHPVGAIRL